MNQIFFYKTITVQFVNKFQINKFQIFLTVQLIKRESRKYVKTFEQFNCDTQSDIFLLKSSTTTTYIIIIFMIL